MRHDKPDANKKVIVDTLRQLGVSVYCIGKPLDLLCHCLGTTSLVEIKNRHGRNKLTPIQEEFIASWPGPIHIVHDIEEAVKALLGAKA